MHLDIIIVAFLICFALVLVGQTLIIRSAFRAYRSSTERPQRALIGLITIVVIYIACLACVVPTLMLFKEPARYFGLMFIYFVFMIITPVNHWTSVNPTYREKQRRMLITTTCLQGASILFMLIAIITTKFFQR